MSAEKQEVKTRVVTVPRGTSLTDALGLPASTKVTDLKLAKPIVIKNGEMTLEILV